MHKALVETTGEFTVMDSGYRSDPETGKSLDGLAHSVKPWRPAVVDLDSNFAQGALNEKRLKLADHGNKLADDATDDEFRSQWDEAKEEQKTNKKTDDQVRDFVISSFSSVVEKGNPKEIKEKAKDVTANPAPKKAVKGDAEPAPELNNSFKS